MDGRRQASRQRRRNAAWPIGALLVSVIVLSAGPASAHDPKESRNAGVLVRQAIALIVNTPGDRDMIEDKVNDATESKDTAGVDIALVEQAKEALDAGDLHAVRTLLERSIGARPHLSGTEVLPIGETGGTPGEPVAATGDETGIDVTTDGLSARRRFDGGTWAALAGMALLVAAGVGLAIRYRPPVSMRALRAGSREA